MPQHDDVTVSDTRLASAGVTAFRSARPAPDGLEMRTRQLNCPCKRECEDLASGSITTNAHVNLFCCAVLNGRTSLWHATAGTVSQPEQMCSVLSTGTRCAKSLCETPVYQKRLSPGKFGKESVGSDGTGRGGGTGRDA